jgi:prepilin-type N-terminal cleavage/methylation domain-containing protein
MTFTSRQAAFSLIELLVVLALTATLSAIVLPVSLGAIHQAKSVECRSRLKQIAGILQAYSNRYQGRFPHEDNGNRKHPKNCAWYLVLPEFSKAKHIFSCPSVADGFRSYKMNSWIEDEAHPFASQGRLRPTDLVMIFDARVNNRSVQLSGKGTWALAEDRHPDGTHLLLVNGSVISHWGDSRGRGWRSPGITHWKPTQR